MRAAGRSLRKLNAGSAAPPLSHYMVSAVGWPFHAGLLPQGKTGNHTNRAPPLPPHTFSLLAMPPAKIWTSKWGGSYDLRFWLLTPWIFPPSTISRLGRDFFSFQWHLPLGHNSWSKWQQQKLAYFNKFQKFYRACTHVCMCTFSSIVIICIYMHNSVLHLVAIT